MKPIETIAAVLVIVGAVNWGLVALAEFDLVAALFADGFGTTSAISRVVYGLVGISGLVLAASLATRSRAPEAAHSRA